MIQEEKEYYSLIKKWFAIWAPFYDILNVLDIFVKIRDRVVDFTRVLCLA